MNPNYTEFKFPQIKAHPWHKVKIAFDIGYFLFGVYMYRDPSTVPPTFYVLADPLDF